MQTNRVKQNIDKQRIRFVDSARGFAMLCIIAGHMWNDTIARVVFTFHVPIFFIVSGIFFKPDCRKFRDNFIKLIKPYTFSFLCITFFDLLRMLIKMIIGHVEFNISEIYKIFIRDIIAGFYGSGSLANFFDFNVTSVGAIWFYLAIIWSLGLVLIIIRLSDRIIKHDKLRSIFRFFISFILWVFSYFSTNYIWLPLSFQAGCSGVIFVIIGIEFKNLFLKKRNICYCLGALFIWVIAIVFSLNNDRMSIVRSCFPNPILNILGAICATFVLLFFFEHYMNLRINRFLGLISEYSMVILSFHLFEMNLIPWEKLRLLDHSLYYEIVIFISVFIMRLFFCFFGIFLIKHIPFLKTIYSINEK